MLHGISATSAETAAKMSRSLWRSIEEAEMAGGRTFYFRLFSCREGVWDLSEMKILLHVCSLFWDVETLS